MPLVQSLTKLEVGQQESDVRVAIIHFDLVCYSSDKRDRHLTRNPTGRREHWYSLGHWTISHDRLDHSLNLSVSRRSNSTT